jgi:hypothetical protein
VQHRLENNGVEQTSLIYHETSRQHVLSIFLMNKYSRLYILLDYESNVDFVTGWLLGDHQMLSRNHKGI